MIPKTYRRVVLAKRPSGEPAVSDFRVETIDMPELRANEVLVRVAYMSLDPYMRGRMRDAASYAKPVPIDGVMEGGTVGEVVASENPAFKVGDTVEGRLGWQEYGISTGGSLRPIDTSIAPISWYNGILGMPGMTAWFGLYEIGQPRPGETVVVSAASGAVGQLVGQLAKLSGCRVVGIAGGPKKCAYIRDELGFDVAVDYKTATFDADLKSACPNGIDVYFDNVGGPVTDAVITKLNFWARIPLCGTISAYNVEEPELGPRLLWPMVGGRTRMQGFIVSDFAPKFEPARRLMASLVTSGKLQYRQDIVSGIDNVPRAFIGLLRGENFGKLQVQLGPDPGKK
ncbi:MAG: NADP-dependent oxidoreductase [Hyphomicrobiaceae bacterium]